MGDLPGEGVEAHIVLPRPLVGVSGERVGHPYHRARGVHPARQAQGLQIEVDLAGPRPVWVEVDHRQDDVVLARGAVEGVHPLGVGEDLVIAGGVEVDVPQLAQRRVSGPGGVEACEEVLDAVAASGGEVTRLVLVLLVVDLLLIARARCGLGQLVARVDAPGWAERGRQDGAQLEGRHLPVGHEGG